MWLENANELENIDSLDTDIMLLGNEDITVFFFFKL